MEYILPMDLMCIVLDYISNRPKKEIARSICHTINNCYCGTYHKETIQSGVLISAWHLRGRHCDEISITFLTSDHKVAFKTGISFYKFVDYICDISKFKPRKQKHVDKTFDIATAWTKFKKQLFEQVGDLLFCYLFFLGQIKCASVDLQKN